MWSRPADIEAPANNHQVIVENSETKQKIRWKAHLWQWKVSKNIGEEFGESAAHVKEHPQACSRSHLFQFGLSEMRNNSVWDRPLSISSLFRTSGQASLG